MKIFITTIIFILGVSTSFSQTYDGEIILNNKGKIKAENINIGNEEITFVKKDQDTTRAIDKSLVSMLRVNVGNYLFEGIGLGVIFAATIYFTSRNDVGINSLVFLYISSGTGLVGGLIGLATTKYRTIKIDKNYTTTLLPRLDFIPQTNYLNLKLIELTIKL